MSQLITGKQFWLPDPATAFGFKSVAQSEVLPEVTGRPLIKRPVSRREWLQGAGVGAAGILLAANTPQQADAHLLHAAGNVVCAAAGLVGALVCFVGAAFYTAALPIIAVVHVVKWAATGIACLAQQGCNPYHCQYASPYVADRVIEPVRSDLYPTTYFELNRFSRVSTSNRFQAYQDLNAPELYRMRAEMPAGGPHRLPSEQYAMRRPLAARDQELYVSTLATYRQNGYVPPSASIRPVYARELISPDGYLHTGFGLITEDGRKNFILADRSSLI